METYGNQTSRKTKTTTTRTCHGRSKKLKVKNWKEAAKDRRTWRDLAEKVKTHRVLLPNDNDDDDDDDDDDDNNDDDKHLTVHVPVDRLHISVLYNL